MAAALRVALKDMSSMRVCVSSSARVAMPERDAIGFGAPTSFSQQAGSSNPNFWSAAAR
jgi:hypothetical protein